jgi:hypothetical protein
VDIVTGMAKLAYREEGTILEVMDDVGMACFGSKHGEIQFALMG